MTKTKKAAGTVSLIIGIVIMATLIFFAVFGKFIAPYAVDESFTKFLPCSREHILGTNNIGRDIWTELIYATSSTLTVGLLSALISLVFGTGIGLLSGYLKGAAGEAINGFINFFLMIPMLPLGIVLAAYLGAAKINVIITIAVLGWCGTARAVRAKTIELRDMPFVESMRVLGYSRVRIMIKHILPNLKEVVFAKYIMSVATCILLEATLSFLGLGDVTEVTWGGMINAAYTYGGFSMGAYNWFLAPGICIMLTVLAFYLINYSFELNIRKVKGSAVTD